MEFTTIDGKDFVIIYRPYITKNGKRLYSKSGKKFKIKISKEKFRY